MSHPHRERLLDVADLGRRLRITALVAVVLGAVAAVVAALAGADVVGTFFLGLVSVVVVGSVVQVALSALTGADRAQKRGERLSGDDVGLIPPRRERA